MFNVWPRYLTASAVIWILCLGLRTLAVGSEVLPDPTRPGIASGGGRPVEAQVTKWVLTSTLISPQRSVAIINDQVVLVGQEVDGARLEAIKPGRVLLSRAGKKIKLKLIADAVKQTVTSAP